jgi:hypothetical protein
VTVSQRALQAPQFDASLAVSVSQPLAYSAVGVLTALGVPVRSQSSHPVAQRVMRQRDAAHTASETCSPPHRALHAPQLLASFARSASQPLSGLPSQSAKPAAQLPTTQRPEAQVMVVCAGAAQRAPHAPQFIASVAVRASQPSLTTPLQSLKPEVHDATTHRGMSQRALALGRVQSALIAQVGAGASTGGTSLTTSPATIASAGALPSTTWGKVYDGLNEKSCAAVIGFAHRPGGVVQVPARFAAQRSLSRQVQ